MIWCANCGIRLIYIVDEDADNYCMPNMMDREHSRCNQMLGIDLHVKLCVLRAM